VQRASGVPHASEGVRLQRSGALRREGEVVCGFFVIASAAKQSIFLRGEMDLLRFARNDGFWLSGSLAKRLSG